MDICALEVGARALSDHIPFSKSVLYSVLLCSLLSAFVLVRNEVWACEPRLFFSFSNREDQDEDEDEEKEKEKKKQVK